MTDDRPCTGWERLRATHGHDDLEAHSRKPISGEQTSCVQGKLRQVILVGPALETDGMKVVHLTSPIWEHKDDPVPRRVGRLWPDVAGRRQPVYTTAVAVSGQPSGKRP